jgi:hypothetical protein
MPSFDAAIFEATDYEGTRHFQWRDLFRQLCEYKAQLRSATAACHKIILPAPSSSGFVWKQGSHYRL